MRITKLDGLRGIFSLMVVLYHYPKECMPMGLYENFLIRHSYAFVDFFFVLSGFVISFNYHHLNKFSTFKVYLKKRFARLYPLLVFTTLIMFLLELIVNLKFQNALVEPLSLAELFRMLADTLLFTNSTPILTPEVGINVPSWSISSEMISYIVFGIIMISVSQRFQKIAFLLLTVICSLFLIEKGRFFLANDYGFIRGLVSFTMGYFVWSLNKIKFKIPHFVELLLLPLTWFVFYYLNQVYSTSMYGLYGLFVMPLFFGLSILIFLKTDGAISKLLKAKIFQFLGKISYSIYLNQMIFIFMSLAIFRYFKIDSQGFLSILIFIAVLVSIIIFSHFTYKYVEKKVGSWLKKIVRT